MPHQTLCKEGRHVEPSMRPKNLKPYPLGWKAKIGILIPAVDTGYCSYEFRVLCPEGVVTLETRVKMGPSPSRCSGRCARMPSAARSF